MPVLISRQITGSVVFADTEIAEGSIIRFDPVSALVDTVSGEVMLDRVRLARVLNGQLVKNEQPTEPFELYAVDGGVGNYIIRFADRRIYAVSVPGDAATPIQLADLLTLPLLDPVFPDYYTADQVNALLNGKQNTLVSGTNIKTVNGNSLLGAGNLTVVAPFSRKINCGGAAERGWLADVGFTGGAIWDFTDTQLHKNTNTADAYPSVVAGFFAGISAPNDYVGGNETIYRYLRYLNGGTINYVISGLAPLATTKVRIHVYTNIGIIPVNQSIKINGVEVEAAHAYSTGIVVKDFTVTASAAGRVSIDFVGATWAGVSGIDVSQGSSVISRTSFFACGDSITDCGTLVGDTKTWPYLLAADPLLDGNQGDRNPILAYIRGYEEDAPWTVRMVAQSGNVIATQTGYIPTYVTPHDHRGWDKQIAFLLCGTNDINAGTSAATIQSNLTAFFAGLSSNVTIRGIGTITGCTSDPTKEAVRQAVNMWIRANSLGLNFVCDFDAAMPDHTNLTYFNPDGIHPTVAGCAVRYGLVKTALQSLGVI